MKVIVVTGGIGSGKSTACRILNEMYGWPVYSADDRAKALYIESPTLLDDIESALGRSFRDSEGSFSPALLAGVIFSDRASLETVESLLFPLLKEDFMQWKDRQGTVGCVILESATILEKPQLKELGDFLLVVDAPKEVRAKRAADRDSVHVDKVLSRMLAQTLMNDVSDGVADVGADLMVLNDGSVEDLSGKLSVLGKLLH